VEHHHVIWCVVGILAVIVYMWRFFASEVTLYGERETVWFGAWLLVTSDVLVSWSGEMKSDWIAPLKVMLMEDRFIDSDWVSWQRYLFDENFSVMFPGECLSEVASGWDILTYLSGKRVVELFCTTWSWFVLSGSVERVERILTWIDQLWYGVVDFMLSSWVDWGTWYALSVADMSYIFTLGQKWRDRVLESILLVWWNEGNEETVFSWWVYRLLPWSAVAWLGRSVWVSHKWLIPLEEGRLLLYEDGRVKGWFVRLSMTQFHSSDNMSVWLKEAFDSHVKWVEFLDVKAFPIARYSVWDGYVGERNGNLIWMLTLKWIEKAVSFDVAVNFSWSVLLMSGTTLINRMNRGVSGMEWVVEEHILIAIDTQWERVR